jgi:hypothetical protein
MRSVRVLLTSAGLLTTALLATSACTAAVAKSTTETNVAGVVIAVHPNSVEAGSSVSLRGSCGDDTNPATISSRAFASVTASPLDGVLSASATVPSTTPAGTYDVDLDCHNGSKASTTLTVLNQTAGNAPAHASVGPHTGGGFLASGEDGGIGDGPVIWIATGLAALLAAAVVSVRTRKRRVPARRR